MDIKQAAEIIKKEFDVNNSLIDQTVNNPDLEIYNFKDKGFLLYMIIDGYTNKKEMIEFFVYLSPEHRNIRNLNKMMEEIETLAIAKACDIIKIGSNSGYNDISFINYLKRKGYNSDVMMKEIK